MFNILYSENFAARFFDEAVKDHQGDDGVGFGGRQAGFPYQLVSAYRLKKKGINFFFIRFKSQIQFQIFFSRGRPKASRISSAEVISASAGFYQAIGASGILGKIEPGTAKTSRLYWVAKSAVISVPLFPPPLSPARRGTFRR